MKRMKRVYKLLCVGDSIPMLRRYEQQPARQHRTLAYFLMDECASAPLYELLDALAAGVGVEREDLLKVLWREVSLGERAYAVEAADDGSDE